MENSFKYKWFGIGDISGSATIVFDNLTNMAIIAFILTGIFDLPSAIVFKKIIPGLALGIIVGNIAYIILAFRLAKRLGHNVTAFPSGLDAPSSVSLSFLIVGPAFLMAKAKGMDPEAAAILSWQIGCACIVFIGIMKLVFAGLVNKIKHWLPTVALLGGIAGVAIGMIIFFPLINMLQFPLVSFMVFAIIIAVFFAGYRLPWNLPAILVAVVLGTIGYYIFQIITTGSSGIKAIGDISLALPTANLGFLAIMDDAAKYFAIAFSFALLVIFGTISVVESARVMGEKYSTKQILLIDGVATILIGIFGGTSQTTAYAGFPAYKKMDAKAGYLGINLLVVGLGAWLGIVNYIIHLIPEAIFAPVLVFIGIEIAIQVFLHAEKKHFPVAIVAILPCIARQISIQLTSNPDVISLEKFTTVMHTVQNGKLSSFAAIVYFGNGFIVTGILWAALMYYLIERRVFAAVNTCLILAVCSLFGIIHSINLDGSMYWVLNLPENIRIVPYQLFGGYLLFALVIVILHRLNRGVVQGNIHE